MQTLRKPFLVAALVLMLLVVLVEAGAVELIRGGAQSATAFLDLVPKDDDLTSALDDLDETTRQMILLRHFGQMSFKEIADCCQCPIGTVLARVHRGYKKLRELIGEEDVTD